MKPLQKKRLQDAMSDVVELIEKDAEGKLCIRWFDDKEIMKKIKRLQALVKKVTLQ